MKTSIAQSRANRSPTRLELSLVLERERRPITAAAFEAIWQSRTHYSAAGWNETQRRLVALYDQLCVAVGRRDLRAILEFARDLAAERFRSGYDLSEVQMAFNALEEAAWSRLCARLDPAELALSLGLVSTVLGAAKDALAREYVSLASQTRVTSLDMRALFSGDASA